MTALKRKVLLLGLDGATFDVLGPWMAEGKLPNLQRLSAGGARGLLTTTIPPVSASAWVSLATGKNPGQHGLFDFVFPRPDGYQVQVANVTYRGAPAMWNLINQAGGKVGLVSVPITYPPEHVDGFVISSFLAPSQDSPYIYPPELKVELWREVGEFPLFLFEGNRSRDPGRFIEDMRGFEMGRVEAVKYLISHKEWDFFAFVFEATDTLQHELWHLLDPAHPRHDPQQAARYRDAILSFYQDVDRALGEIVALAGEDTLVIVMSDHGFGSFHRFFHINNWLRELGLLKLRRNPWTLLKRAAFRLGFTPMNVLRLVTLLRLSRLRKNVKRGRGRGLLRRVFLSFDDVDWGRTRAFSVGNFGEVYLNVRGQRSQGVIEPGEEYEAVRERIIREALALRDPETGDAVIFRAYRREDIYHGARVDAAPDLILHTDRAKYVSFGHADFGSNRLVEPSYGQTGHHNMDGVLVMHGPGVETGRTLQGARIVDIAPTVLYALGLPVPADMDGRVLEDAFTAVHRAAHPVTLTEGVGPDGRQSQDYPAEDEALVVERLRALGYVS